MIRLIPPSKRASPPRMRRRPRVERGAAQRTRSMERDLVIHSRVLRLIWRSTQQRQYTATLVQSARNLRRDAGALRAQAQAILKWRQISKRSEERRVGKECRSRWA